MLCRLEGRTLTLRLAGVDSGGAHAYSSGTYMAMYVLILQWAAEHGLTRVDLSGCEPFLSKGIFQFKRKIHPEVALPDNHFANKRLLLRVRRDSPEVRDFLTANPLLGFGQGSGSRRSTSTTPTGRRGSACAGAAPSRQPPPRPLRRLLRRAQGPKRRRTPAVPTKLPDDCTRARDVRNRRLDRLLP
ncbi:hypothetical protein NKH18_47120 [Streptomyces sp. M10(2022)]